MRAAPQSGVKLQQLDVCVAAAPDIQNILLSLRIVPGHHHVRHPLHRRYLFFPVNLTPYGGVTMNNFAHFVNWVANPEPVEPKGEIGRKPGGTSDRGVLYQIQVRGLQIGFLIALWALACSIAQKDYNTSKYIAATVIVVLAIFYGTFGRYLSFIGGWIVVAVSVALGWLWWGGSYHHKLDFVLLILCFLGVAWLFKSFREWVKFCWVNKRRRGRILTYVRVLNPRLLLALPSHPFHNWAGLWFAVTFLCVFWAVASLGDFLAMRGRSALHRDPTRFTRLKNESAYPNLKIGVALSGGGYRAALMHAGVLDALEQLHVPVTHLTSVSGGSIIGAFYAIGGHPRDFRDAVIAERFNLTREVSNLGNAVRLVLPMRIPNTATRLVPVREFERTDVQAELLDSVLLGDTKFNELEGTDAPRLMICTTDLYTGQSLGISKQGVLRRYMLKPSEKDSFRNLQPPTEQEKGAFIPAGKGFPYNGRLSRVVAASGAFPGAFNAIEEAIGSGNGNQKVMLADGGISDNSALTAMTFAPRVKGEWHVDVAFSSDAGALFNEKQSIPALGELTRAIDIVYANVGVRSEVDARVHEKTQFLLSPAKYLDLRGEKLSRSGGESKGIDQLVGDSLKEADAQTLEMLLRIVREDESNPAAATINLADAGARGALAPLVAEELDNALKAFSSSSTLKDHFEGHTAAQLFRLGQLLVALEWKGIKEELDAITKTLDEKQKSPALPQAVGGHASRTHR
jgi:NTE family protein